MSRISRGLNRLDGKRLELEVSMLTVITICVLAGVYVYITSTGISIIDDCDKIKEDEFWIKAKEYMSHSLAIVLTIPATLLLMKFFGEDAGAFFLLFSILGLATSGIALTVINKCKPEGDLDDDWKFKDVTSKVGLGVYGLFLVMGFFLLNRKHNVVNKLKGY